MNVTGIHFLFSLLIFLFSKGGGISYVATHHSDEYRAFRGGSHWFFRFLISLWFNSKKVWDICHNTKNIWTLMAPTLWGTITTSSTTKEYDSKKFSLLTLNNARASSNTPDPLRTNTWISITAMEDSKNTSSTDCSIKSSTGETWEIGGSLDSFLTFVIS